MKQSISLKYVLFLQAILLYSAYFYRDSEHTDIELTCKIMTTGLCMYFVHIT